MSDLTGGLKPPNPNRIKVLVVEDSPTIAKLLSNLFSSDPALEVIGIARDGAEAIRMVGRLRPNVITMDVQMPNVDGLEATEYIMAHHPTPILVLTASLGKKDVNLSLKMLSAGALEILEKPAADAWETASRHLIERVKLISRIKVITHIRAKSRLTSKTLGVRTEEPVAPAPQPVAPRPVISREDKATAPLRPMRHSTKTEIQPQPFSFEIPPDLSRHKFAILTVAASTGGPPALVKVLSSLPANLSVPVLVVQHIPPGFSAGLAEWLNNEIKLKVKNAEDGEVPKPGLVYLATDDRHLAVYPNGNLHLSEAPPRMGLRPCADVTFESLAVAYPGRTLNVILTGMGRDGTAGIKLLKEKGCFNIAQDEASSVIYGMPKSAIEAGVVDKVLSLGDIGAYLTAILQS